MRDADIRRVLRDEINKNYKRDNSIMIIEELGLCRGKIRADIAVVNGMLNGYEIKSSQDTLIRLSNQAAAYNRIFDTVTIVVAERHLQSSKKIIPSWWGIQLVTMLAPSSVAIECIRKASINEDVDPNWLVQLLWRDEVFMLLEKGNQSKSLTGKPRRILWDTLVRNTPLPELKDLVRTCLRNRPQWRRVDAQQRSSDEKFQPFATLSDSLYQHSLPRNRRYIYRPN